MAETYTLEAQPRALLGKQVKQLRKQDLIPGVIYGLGDKPIHVTCQRRPLDIVLQKAGGTHIVNISVEGKAHSTLIREVQRDKIKRLVLHVDFLRVDLTKKLRTEVAIVMVHHPRLGADLLLSQNLQTIEIECLPTDIPEHVEVDVSGLTTAGARITVADLPRMANVEFISDPHDVVARIDLLMAEVTEEEAGTEAAAAEPEVIEKGKKEEEEF